MEQEEPLIDLISNVKSIRPNYSHGPADTLRIVGRAATPLSIGEMVILDKTKGVAIATGFSSRGGGSPMDITPCPYCGNQNLSLIGLPNNCQVFCPGCDSYGRIGASENEAIENWNMEARKINARTSHRPNMFDSVATGLKHVFVKSKP